MNAGLKLTTEQFFGLREQHDIVLNKRIAFIIKDPIIAGNDFHPHIGLPINDASKVTSWRVWCQYPTGLKNHLSQLFFGDTMAAIEQNTCAHAVASLRTTRAGQSGTRMKRFGCISYPTVLYFSPTHTSSELPPIR